MEDHSCEWLWSLSFNLRLGIQMCICNCGNLQCKMSPHCSKNAIAGEQCTVNCISQESKPARPVCHCLSVFVCTVHCLQEVLATSSHLVHTLVARISNGQLPVVELVAHRCGRSQKTKSLAPVEFNDGQAQLWAPKVLKFQITSNCQMQMIWHHDLQFSSCLGCHTLVQTCLVELRCGTHRSCKNTPVKLGKTKLEVRECP